MTATKTTSRTLDAHETATLKLGISALLRELQAPIDGGTAEAAANSLSDGAKAAIDTAITSADALLAQLDGEGARIILERPKGDDVPF